jgi:hypothetical protein
MSLDEWDDPEDPEPEDEDESSTVACPECGAVVYEDSPRCPVCETYIAHATNAWLGKPFWWIVLGLAGILAVILMLSPL